ncbi:superoxide dismutase family protein [Aquisediminimonas profunda]|uniref:superoxide dismutase family protein n=1 Tax=Aquisediminimonas profunda TaxID=1550733 RepID=UPI001C62C203|nr:superoxide dismutase family protein [Aquisediminimonas profunda]
MRAYTVPLLLAFACPGANAFANPASVTAPLLDASGAEHGSVRIREKGGMLIGDVKATNLEPGLHGLHIHAAGRCSGDGFADAGGHWNPQGKQHGLDNPMGAHLGDLPQLNVGANGKGRARFMVMSTLDQLLDSDGSALVVHAKPDDGRTDPSGNSGPRLLCAALNSAR